MDFIHLFHTNLAVTFPITHTHSHAQSQQANSGHTDTKRGALPVDECHVGEIGWTEPCVCWREGRQAPTAPYALNTTSSRTLYVDLSEDFLLANLFTEYYVAHIS